jgi:hypothetical protein
LRTSEHESLSEELDRESKNQRTEELKNARTEELKNTRTEEPTTRAAASRKCAHEFAFLRKSGYSMANEKGQMREPEHRGTKEPESGRTGEPWITGSKEPQR